MGRPPTRSFLLSLCLSAGMTPAQEPPPQHLADEPGLAAALQPGDVDSVFDAFGVCTVDGEIVAGGPSYRARFLGDRVEYTAVMPTAPHTMPLSLRVVGFGRGTATCDPGPADVDATGRAVRYRRPHFVETWDVQQNGLKQSFVFERLPAGAGDLVVTLQLDTALTPDPQRSTDELRFRHGEHGGVSIRDVLGIDATGRRQAGSMRLADGNLELRLPAGFVETAALPLVLDPYVGTLIPVSGSTPNDFDPDVAYDGVSNRYLVTWRRTLSASDSGVRGAMVDLNGNIPISFLDIASSGINERPRCASVTTEGAFVVVFARGGNAYGRAIRGNPAAIGNETPLMVHPDSFVGIDVGGDRSISDRAVLLVDNNTLDEIQGKFLTVDGSANPPTLAPSPAAGSLGVTFSTSGGSSWFNADPAIAKSCTVDGVFCISWTRTFSSNNDTQVRARLIDRSLTPQSVVLNVTTQGDNDAPEVDGDGENWIIAWEHEDSAGSGDNDVQARSVGQDFNMPPGNRGFLQSPIVDIEAQLNDNERRPTVAWMGDSALIMYEDGVSAGVDDGYLQPVDMITARKVAPRLLLPTSPNDQNQIRAASRFSGADEVDGALVVWSEIDGAGDNDMRTIRYTADDGITRHLANGCDSISLGYAGAAIAGNANFRFDLRNDNPNTMVVLVVSLDRFDIPCAGGCLLVPDPFAGFVVARTTDAHGNASLPAPLPAGTVLVGLKFFHQWIGLNLGVASCQLGGMTIPVETTIQ